MTKFITILIGCSLTLAASVKAEQEDPKKQKSKPVQKQQIAPKQHAVPNTHVQGVHTQHAPNLNNAKVHNNNLPKQQFHTAPVVHPNKMNAIHPNNLDTVHPNKMNAIHPNNLDTVHPNKLNAVNPNTLNAVQANKRAVQTFHPQHQNFHANPNAAITSARFNNNFRIRGAENWHGSNYAAFRSYHPQWHDRGWWHSHHNHIVLIGGGWYFWNAGYWYPAWGYDTSAAYYPYDGPIYVGNNPTPFDQIVADVQTTLQEQGYYHGEVDGLVGPLTQEALAAYQSAQGLEPTAAIDEPTLDSLGLNS
jgi:Putative peptidoglycan binding domain